MRHRLKIRIQKATRPLFLLRAAVSFVLWMLMLYLALHHRTCVYLARQGAAQFRILAEARDPDPAVALSQRALANLNLLPELKRYTVDSLGFDPTRNYEKIYYHGTSPVLWVVTASQPYALEPVYWRFPVVGRVSYKGFFDKHLAAAEFLELRRRGLDAEVSPVTAYSTLGWFPDPVFSAMLERNKGAFCNLIFHELFHATYYKSGNVNLNENLASFIAHKATLKYLAADTAALMVYLSAHTDQQRMRRFLQRKAVELDLLYRLHKGAHDLPSRKAQAFRSIADSVERMTLNDPRRGRRRAKHIAASGNAYFVGYDQYESLQDSLEFAFNKFYRRSIKNMVHDLKRR